jgi:elongation factor P
MIVQVTNLKRGMVIKLEGIPYSVLEVAHITPGNWRGMVSCRLRNLANSLSKEMRFRSTERVEEVEIEETEMEFIYFADGNYYFMNLENYEQMYLDRDIIGDYAKLLTPNIRVKVEYFDGKPFGIILPKTVTLKVIETQAHMKDATAQAQTKPATLEGGHVCQVPAFIQAGELIKVNTETGEYLERA